MATALHLRTRGGSPTDRQAPGAGGRRRVVIALVSGLTMVWLVAQSAAGVLLRRDTWPVAGFPMFAEAPRVNVEPTLYAHTAGGGTIRLEPHDFRLTRDQYVNHLARRIARPDGRLQPRAEEQVRLLVRIWRKDRPGLAVDSVSLVHDVQPLNPKAVSRRVDIAAWTTP